MIAGLGRGDPLHLLGVAGTAMASLAGLLSRLGYRVTGSDQGAFPPMSTLLEREGIAVRTPFSPENLPDPCRAVVVGNAVSRGNPELEAALDQRLPLLSFPETLRELVLRPRIPVVVAGTHGKTTTTSLLAWILRASGRDAGFLVGGVATDLGGSFRLGAAGEPFVVEGDEYDTAYWDKGPKFLHYLPEVAIVGNVEFDHADIYPDFAAVRRAFSFLARLPPSRGLLLLGADSPAALELERHAHTTVRTFGLSHPADWTASIEDSRPSGTRIAPAFRGEAREPLEGRFWGSASARNVLAAAAAADWLGVPWEAIRGAVAGFSGVARRLQTLAESEDGRVGDRPRLRPPSHRCRGGAGGGAAALAGSLPGRRLRTPIVHLPQRRVSGPLPGIVPRRGESPARLGFGRIPRPPTREDCPARPGPPDRRPRVHRHPRRSPEGSRLACPAGHRIGGRTRPDCLPLPLERPLRRHPGTGGDERLFALRYAIAYASYIVDRTALDSFREVRREGG